MSDQSDVSDQGSDNESTLSMDKLMKWTVKELKTWCSQHKQKISGKNKEVFAKRVFRAMNYFASDSSSSDNIDTDRSDDDNDDNSAILPTSWASVTTDAIPPIRPDDVKNHFVYNKNPVSGRQMKFQRQLMKAKKISSREIHL
jgi:hypothetical protein